MKRLVVMASLCLVAVCAVAGTTAGSAAAAWHCLKTFLGEYEKDGAEQCKEYGILVLWGWDLFETATAKTVATGVLCALVDTKEPSLYDGPDCKSSEERKGEGEYAKALELEERFASSVESAALSITKIKTQIFTTNEGTVECSNAAASGVASGAEVSTQSIVIKYSSCNAFGFVEADVSAADYDLSVNGEVLIEKQITIEVPLIGCAVTIPAQSVKSVAYTNSGSNLLLTPNVAAISYSATGECTDVGTFKNGTFTGTSELSITKGVFGFVS